MKRHLATVHDLTPDAYRAKWGLAHDHAMVSPGAVICGRPPRRKGEFGLRRRSVGVLSSVRPVGAAFVAATPGRDGREDRRPPECGSLARGR